MIRFHISPDGTPRVCSAKNACRYGNVEHFASAAEARASYEEEQVNLTSPLRKRARVLHSYYFAETYPEEWEALSSSFDPEQLITEPGQADSNSIVLPRYRTVPFGELLEDEVEQRGGKLINTAAESEAVRNLFHWVPMLGSLTAPAYTLDNFGEAPEGAYFVKGQTSSLKNRGPASAFAESKKAALALAKELAQDSWLAHETIALRPVQPYRRLGTTRSGLPIFNERRVFTYRGQVLSEGFYWHAFRDCLNEPEPVVNDAYWETVHDALARVREVAPFLVVDMAQYEDHHWGVVELNDGCQAGFAGANAREIYEGLARAMNNG